VEIFLELRKFSRFPKIINGAAVRNSGAIAQAAAMSEEGDFFQLSRARRARVARNFIRFRGDCFLLILLRTSRLQIPLKLGKYWFAYPL
jgi:hypothetical protein